MSREGAARNEEPPGAARSRDVPRGAMPPRDARTHHGTRSPRRSREELRKSTMRRSREEHDRSRTGAAATKTPAASGKAVVQSATSALDHPIRGASTAVNWLIDSITFDSWSIRFEEYPQLLPTCESLVPRASDARSIHRWQLNNLRFQELPVRETLTDAN